MFPADAAQALYGLAHEQRAHQPLLEMIPVRQTQSHLRGLWRKTKELHRDRIPAERRGQEGKEGVSRRDRHIEVEGRDDLASILYHGFRLSARPACVYI